METDLPFTTRPIGTSGYEILSPGGEVVAWTVDGHWAALVVAALNIIDHGELSLKYHQLNQERKEELL